MHLRTKNIMLEVVTATMLSIFALLIAVFSTDWVLGNGKHSDRYNGHKKNSRPGIYAFMDIIDEIDRKQKDKEDEEKKKYTPIVLPERGYRSSAEVVADFKLIMAELDKNEKNNAPYEAKNKR